MIFECLVFPQLPCISGVHLPVSYEKMELALSSPSLPLVLSPPSDGNTFNDLLYGTYGMAFTFPRVAKLIAKYPILCVPACAIEEYHEDENVAFTYTIKGERFMINEDEWRIFDHPSDDMLVCLIFTDPDRADEGHPWHQMNKHIQILQHVQLTGRFYKLLTEQEWFLVMPVGDEKHCEQMKCGIRSESKTNKVCDRKTFVPKKWLHDTTQIFPTCCGTTPVCDRSVCTGCKKLFLRSCSAISTLCVSCHSKNSDRRGRGARK